MGEPRADAGSGSGRAAGRLAPAVLIALAVRLLPLPFVAPLLPGAAAAGLGSDGAAYYLPLAHGLAERGEFSARPGEPSVRHVPLFPLLLAGLERLGIDSPAGRAAAQSLLGSLALVLLFAWVRGILGPRAGWIALALLAALPDFAVYSYLDMSENLASVLMLMAVLAFERARAAGGARAWAITGALVGLAALAREFCATLVVPLGAAALWGAADRGRRLRSMGILILAASGVILPWTLRNLAATSEWVPLSEKTGWSAYVGTLIGDHPPGGERWAFDPARPAQRDRHRRLLLSLAEEPSPGARSRMCWRAAWENLAEAPGEQARHLLRKAGFFWRPNVGPRHAARLGPGLRPLLALAAALYGACLASAAGAALTRRGRGAACRLAWLLIGWTFAAHLALGSAEPRYHFLVLPAVAALAAVALEEISARVAARLARPATKP